LALFWHKFGIRGVVYFYGELRTVDSGRLRAGIAAVEVALYHLIDNGSEEALLLLETTLVLDQKLVEVMN
jgi:hypothetical protein